MKIKTALLLFVTISVIIGCKRTTEKTSDKDNRTTLNATEFKPNVGALKVACIGNSITEGDGIEDKENDSYPAQLQTILGADFHVKNFGVSGRTLLRKGDFPYWNEDAFQKSKDFQPDVVVILLGTNDSKPENWKYNTEFVKDYQVFIDEFQALDSKPKIYLCNPPPAFDVKWGISNEVIIKSIMPKIEKIAISKELTIIDLYEPLAEAKEMFPDAIHPNEEGAKVIAETVAKHLTVEKE